LNSEPLWVTFCANTVELQCPRGELRDTLEILLAHCLVDDGSDGAVATCRVTFPETDKALVECDGEVVYNGSRTGWAVLYVLQNLTNTLTGKCLGALNFHSGGLARDGRGILLCGASGSGKSTLTAWLTGSGYAFLTDELVSISAEDWRMTGLSRPIHLKPGSVFVVEHWLGDQVHDEVRMLPDGSALVLPSAFAHTEIVRSAVPEIVLFPKYSAQSDLRCERLSTAATAFRLAHSLVNAINLPGQGMGQVVALSKRITGYSVEFSRPEDVAVWMDSILR
jgi:hypothetical protein